MLKFVRVKNQIENVASNFVINQKHNLLLFDTLNILVTTIIKKEKQLQISFHRIELTIILKKFILLHTRACTYIRIFQ